MTDPLSIGASVLASIGLADRIIRTCKHYIEAVEDAPRDIQTILGEATSLRAIIDSIGESSATSLMPNLHEQNGPIKSCHSCLASLEALLPPTMGQSQTGKRRKITLADLAWTLKQSKVRKLLAEISHHKATLLLAMSGDMSRDLKEIRMGIERPQGTISESETREIIRWFERTNPSSLHNIAFNKHEPLTTEWVTNSSQWKAWLSLTSETRLIWIHGLPGSGKTVLASYVIEELEMLCKPANGSVCSYYYCHYSHNQDETVPFLSWIIGHRWHARFDEIEEVLAAMAQGMFRWAECQIQAIERLRDQSKLQQLLSNLPKDLSETYVRIFEAIPEEDRPLVRCILTWIIGHSQAAWIYHVGVNANLLLSAVTYEHFGSETKGQKPIIDLEYLKEICSCLITVRYVPGDIFDSWLEESPGLQAREATDGEDLYVSLAHYTVLEFLVSPHVFQPNFAFFAMSPELIRLKFAKSVLKQAVAADPKGTNTDWIHDREAYCLTLGCALYLYDILAETDLQGLFIRYINPSSPHYSRFEAIQSKIVQGDEGSKCYFLRHIPARIHFSATGDICYGTAAALMNLHLLWNGTELTPMIRRLLNGRQIQELLDTKVTVTFIEESEEELEEAGNGLCMSDRGSYRLKTWEVEIRDIKETESTDTNEKEKLSTDKEVWVRRKQRIG
ncbi:hypothetical protein FocTR4_00012624 [Fusarium oxysporum f. sp. cubense]|uniref:Uncharacterized protein n=2 Tax=Fusarium oxysporum species complex TaxID=171631 RepID=A0A5C6SPC1_FUSOC|nr:hypothetical protein FocTR4_00012624 [Fusarium oxysporum f. sp. cubense]